MYHSGKNPLRKLHREGGEVQVPRSPRTRKLHKAFLRYHDADNWPLLREALVRMRRGDLIGYGKRHLVPPRQPAGWQPKVGSKARGNATSAEASTTRTPRRGRFYTQHTGLPPKPRG
jgi:hypothetical protein